MRSECRFWIRGWRASALRVVLLAGIGAGGCVPPDVTSGDFVPTSAPLLDNFHTIVPGRAYRSAQLDPATLRLVIETYGIRTIVNLRGEHVGTGWYDREKAVADDLGVRLDNVRFSAHALPPGEELLKLYDDFATADYPILIHCDGGADRSGAAAAIWRMEINGDPRDVALRELSLAYGHIAAAAPQMDQLALMFQNDRNWVLYEYVPAIAVPK